MRFLIALLALAGLVVSILALKVHNMDPNQAPPCKVDGKWDCGAVNHSRFAVFAILALFGRLWIVLHLAEIGFLCASFLSYLEAFVLEKWCIYCVWSQGLVTAILLLTIGVLVTRWRQQRSTLKGVV